MVEAVPHRRGLAISFDAYQFMPPYEANTQHQSAMKIAEEGKRAFHEDILFVKFLSVL